MKATPPRRRLIVLVLLGLAVIGGVTRHFAADPSLARDIGTLLLVLWLPVIGNVVAYMITQMRARVRICASFAPDAPFVAHLRVRLTPLAAPSATALTMTLRERDLTLVLGTEGFTVRQATLSADWLAAGDDVCVQLEFLRPALARSRFPAATRFRILSQGKIVADGQVLEAHP